MARAPLSGIHIWTEGDTWWRIAEKYTGHGLNWVALAQANDHIPNPNAVPEGARVHLPRELTE